MFLGRVIGEVWATRKANDLVGKRLLVIEPLERSAKATARGRSPVSGAAEKSAAGGTGSSATTARWRRNESVPCSPVTVSVTV